MASHPVPRIAASLAGGRVAVKRCILVCRSRRHGQNQADADGQGHLVTLWNAKPMQQKENGQSLWEVQGHFGTMHMCRLGHSEPMQQKENGQSCVEAI